MSTTSIAWLGGSIVLYYQRYQLILRYPRRYKTKPILIENRRWDPATGTLSAALDVSVNVMKATGDIFIKPYEEYKHAQSEKRRQSSSHSRVGSTSSSTNALTRARSSTNLSERSNGSNSSSSSSRNGLQTAGLMATASAKAYGKFMGYYFKGLIVDIPLAAAEGMRVLPKLYGEEVQDHGQVRDWESGAIVGAKSFVHGLAGGLADFVVQPYKGAKEGGALGAAKGFAKGTISMAAKTTHGKLSSVIHFPLLKYITMDPTDDDMCPLAALGLVAYPGQGICRSLRAAVKTNIRNHIMTARHVEGQYLLSSGDIHDNEDEKVMKAFDVLGKKGPSEI